MSNVEIRFKMPCKDEEEERDKIVERFTGYGFTKEQKGNDITILYYRKAKIVISVIKDIKELIIIIFQDIEYDDLSIKKIVKLSDTFKSNHAKDLRIIINSRVIKLKYEKIIDFNDRYYKESGVFISKSGDLQLDIKEPNIVELVSFNDDKVHRSVDKITEYIKKDGIIKA